MTSGPEMGYPAAPGLLQPAQYNSLVHCYVVAYSTFKTSDCLHRIQMMKAQQNTHGYGQKIAVSQGQKMNRGPS